MMGKEGTGHEIKEQTHLSQRLYPLYTLYLRYNSPPISGTWKCLF